MRDKVVILLLIYFSILALYKERESLGCKDNSIIGFLTSTPPCDNYNNQYSRIIREQRPKNPFDIFDRIVIWRRSFILSLLIVLVYHFSMGYPFESMKMLSSIIVGTFFIYFSFSFYKYHLDEYVYKDIIDTYDVKLK